MKLTVPTIGVLATVIVLASVGGVYAMSYYDVVDFTSLAKENTPTGAAMMLGNVKAVHLDEDGKVIGLRHGSNHITASGMQVIMGQLFFGKNATYPDTANVTGRLKYMEIGYGGEQAVYVNQLRWNNTDILDPVAHNPATNTCDRIRLDPIAVNTSATWNPGPVDPFMPHPSPTQCTEVVAGGGDDRETCAARMNHTAIATFPGAICGDGVGTIDEAGIYTASQAECNAGNCGMMFARNTFGSVVLGNMDTLRLEWEFSFRDTVP